MRHYYPTEQVELLHVGGKVFAVFRDQIEAISGAIGRTYHLDTETRIKRIVDVMNNSTVCECAVKQHGMFISSVAWRKHPTRIYTNNGWVELQKESQ